MKAPVARLLVRDVVAPSVGSVISESGFRFAASRSTFSRITDECRQSIHLGPEVSPHYAPSAIVVLQPTIRVEFEAISPILEHVGIPGSGASIVQPAAYGGPTRQWEITSEAIAPLTGGALADDIRARILPLLDALRTPADLLAAYAAQDARIMWHEQVYASVILAHVLTGQLDEARSIASARFRGQALVTSFPSVARLLET